MGSAAFPVCGLGRATRRVRSLGSAFVLVMALLSGHRAGYLVSRINGYAMTFPSMTVGKILPVQIAAVLLSSWPPCASHFAKHRHLGGRT